MGILDWGLGTDEQYIECRQCGQTVDSPDEPCPFCGCTEIAEYDF
jgi:rubrerythrin